jgi:LytS/YehU family sensor histidine kinase
MVRAVMEGIRAPAWPLARELELLDALFELYLIRDPRMFTLERSIADGVSGILVPPMILLPLAENAMKHGPAKGASGTVRLAAAIAGETVRVRLENPGAFAGRRDGGVGIATVEQRLALAYEGAATLAIHGAGDATVAELTLPRRGPRE